jgi:pimeloyl-ACP methyl ester carboxylesterase
MRPATLHLAGGALEAAWWGPPPGEAPTLVLLHEGLGCVSLWRDIPARLAEATGRGVFAWSRFGYGQSDPATLPRPLDYMQIEAREVLPAVLDAAGIGACLLVGHSDGGSIAAFHAGTVRDPRVRGLALIAPHFFVEQMCLDAIAAAREAYATGDLRARLARHHRDVDNAFRGWNDAWLDPGFRSWDIRPALSGIDVPALVLQGEADPYGTAAQPAALAARTRCQVKMLPGLRHAPHLESPAAFAELAQFCYS